MPAYCLPPLHNVTAPCRSRIRSTCSATNWKLGELETANEEENHRTAFWEWLESSGVSGLDKVQIQSFDGIRGVAAAHDVEAESVLFKVPRRVLAESLNVADSFPIFTATSESLPSPQYLLASWLLLEQQKGEESEHAPYLRLLPSREEILEGGGSLDYWSQEEVAKLELPLLQELRTGRVQRTASVHRLLASEWEATFLSAAPTLEAVQDAVALVYSRAFQAKGEANLALVPLVDMINHDHPFRKNAKTYFDEKGDFTVAATMYIPKGSQIFLSYGKLSNAHLIQSHGFTMSTNPYDFAVVDCAPLLEGLGSDFSQRIIREKLLFMNHGSEISRYQPLAKSLETALEMAWEDSHSNIAEIFPVCTNSKQFLCILVKSTLDQFSTSLEDEENLVYTLQLEDHLDTTQFRLLNAARVRLEQKRILTEHLSRNKE